MNKEQPDYPTIAFSSAAEFEAWIHSNTTAAGVWLKIAKKSSGIPTVTYDEALDIALCYGWIDGLKRSFDEMYFLQKFTPRRPKSLWSKRNVTKVAQLIAAGRMQPSGLTQITAAKADGRWDATYDGAKDMVLPQEFIEQLARNKKAQAAYDLLSRSAQYAIYFQLTIAKKPETRQRRIDAIIAELGGR